MNSAHELTALIDALRRLRIEPACTAALATITRTRGSTFRRAGTRMVIYHDGAVVCELSGGCPQRDIIARAQAVIAEGRPRLIQYNAESGLDVLMEMGCGGELEVLLEPLDAARSTRFIDALDQCLAARRVVHLATVFAIDGEVIAPRRMLWDDSETLYSDIDDEALVTTITATSKDETANRIVTRCLLCERGPADVLIEPITPAHALFVIGSSAAARALLPLANALGWETTLVDSDASRLQARDLPDELRTICATPHSLRDLLALDAHSSVVVMTHNLEQDMAYLAALEQAPVAYLGALGSRERVAHMREHATVAHMHVHAPAGLDIGSEAPAEIALAIASEIMAVINQRSGGSLRDNYGAIHS